MRILALETSTEFCSCALSIDGVMRESHVRAGQAHSDLLLPAVARLMAEAGLGFAQLDAIAFGAGPGSFTGLRIACGAAQGLAFAHDLPVLPVVSLMALAEGMDTGIDARRTATHVISALDARMGELYLAAYERVGTDWRAMLAPGLAKADDLPVLPARSDWQGVGSGFAVCGAALTARYDVQNIDATAVPRAAAIATIALRAMARGEALAAHQAAPLYVRDKVALDVNEQAALRARNARHAAADRA